MKIFLLLGTRNRDDKNLSHTYWNYAASYVDDIDISILHYRLHQSCMIRNSTSVKRGALHFRLIMSFVEAAVNYYINKHPIGVISPIKVGLLINK